jgi:preprotein translocase subunit SecY
MSVKTCTGCEKNTVQGIPFVVYEKEMTRYERVIKKLWVIIILLIVFLVGSNIVWIVYDKQFETVESSEEYTIEQDAESGNNNSIINGREIENGKTEDNL